jgi:SAM-dependent methyltransferase
MANDKWANPQSMWDERFSQVAPVYGEEPNAYLREQVARLKPNSKVFVPGDGYGRNGLWLAKQGFEVNTVDLSPIGVERARKAAETAGVKMIAEQANLSAWNWPENEFDAVAAIYLHLPPEVRAGIHEKMLRAVLPGGIVVLEAFTTAQLQHSSGGPKQLDLLYTEEMLRKDFAAADVLELEECEVHLDEGHMHRGPAAVVRAVFQRK